MDRRKRWWLAAGLLFGAVGCASTGHKDRGPAGGPQLNAPVSKSAYNASEPVVQRPPRATDRDRLAAALQVGDLWSNSVMEKKVEPAQRDELAGKALASYEEAVRIDPNCLAAHVGIARAAGLLNQRERSLAEFRKAMEADPKQAGVWCEMGLTQARWKDWPAAVDSLAKAVEMAPDNRAFGKTLGLTLARAGRTDEAFGALTRVMGEDEARVCLAKMHEHLDQADAAVRQVQLALKANPANEAARMMLAAYQSAPAAAPSPEAETPAVATAPAPPATTESARPDPLEDPALRPVVYEEPAAPFAAPPELPSGQPSAPAAPPVVVPDPDGPVVGFEADQ